MVPSFIITALHISPEVTCAYPSVRLSNPIRSELCSFNDSSLRLVASKFLPNLSPGFKELYTEIILRKIKMKMSIYYFFGFIIKQFIIILIIFYFS